MLGFGWLKKKSKQGVDAGAGFGKKITNWEEIKNNWSEIGKLYDTLANPKKIQKSTASKTFLQAVLDNKLSQEDIKKIYFNYSLAFYISVLFSFVAFFSSLYSAYNASLGGSVAGLAIWLVCVANMFRFSFNTFRIKHQKFCSVQDWWNNPNQWIPSIKL